MTTLDDIWEQRQALLRRNDTPSRVYLGYQTWRELCLSSKDHVSIVHSENGKKTVLGLEVYEVAEPFHVKVTT